MIFSWTVTGQPGNVFYAAGSAASDWVLLLPIRLIMEKEILPRYHPQKVICLLFAGYRMWLVVPRLEVLSQRYANLSFVFKKLPSSENLQGSPTS